MGRGADVVPPLHFRSAKLELFFRLNVGFNDFLKYYQGDATMVEVKDIEGRVLWINARHFRHYVTRDGIQGLFRMELDKQGELQLLQKLE